MIKSFLLIAVALLPLASEAFVYTQNNVLVTYHEAPATFSVAANGEAMGATVSGIPFRQLNVSNDLGVRLQRFEIGIARWYVSDLGVIYATSDLEALSIYISRIV